MRFLLESKTRMNFFAIFIGAFLLIEGIWGLTSPVVLGVLTTNTTHAIIHIALGLVGIVTGIRGTARGFCIFLGILLAGVGLLWFVPGANELLVRLLNVNRAVALFNIVVGVIALLFAFFPRASGRENTL